MSTTRVRPRHEITIPKDVAAKLSLEVGDLLEAHARSGKLILVPKKAKGRKPQPPLSLAERKLLARIEGKMERIRKNLAAARGLTPEEANLAVRAGLVASAQRWWWLEDWQRGEREADEAVASGAVSGPFSSAKELIGHLRKQQKSKARQPRKR